MIRLALRGLATRKLRAALSALAIVLGVGMVAATFVVTDRIFGAFDEIFATANKGTDVLLTRATKFDVSSLRLEPLDADLVARVAALPGVAETSGSVQGDGALVVDGKTAEAVGGAPDLVISSSAQRFDQNVYVSGKRPVNPGEISIDKDLADRKKVRIGQAVGLQTDVGVKPVTVTGIFKFANASLGGATIKIIPLADAQAWFGRAGQVSLINVAAKDGISPGQLSQQLRAALPPSVKVQTGDENAKEQSKQINDQLGAFLRPALFTFAGVSVLVGIFTIFNIFAITVAQRARELAMLRTLGAAKGQLVRSLMLEALVIGVIASVLGVLAGIGLAVLISGLFDAVGFGLPTTGIVVKPRTVVIALTVGIVTTLLAALIPALRATRVSPIAALREGAIIPPGRFARVTPYLAGLVTLGGLLLLIAGLTTSGSTQQRLSQVAFGAVLVFVGVGTLSRYIIRPLARLVGAPIQVISPTAGGLARENAGRNPARTAATAAALMIGVALVVFTGVLAEGLKGSFTDAIDRSVKSDLIIQTKNQSGTLPEGTVVRAANVAGVAAAAPTYFAQARVFRETQFINAVPADAANVYKLDWQRGATDALVGKLGADGVIVEKDFAATHSLVPGDTVTVTGPTGSVKLRVLGEYKDPTLFRTLTMGTAAYDKLFTDRRLGVLSVKFATGADPSATTAAVKRAFEAYPSAKVQSNAEFKKTVSGQIDGLLALLYVLLAISVVISLFGIVTTLVLSVFERTREIGMIRAVGATRGQIRGIVCSESVITSTIGAILGIGLGLVFGWLMTKALEDQGIRFSVPVGQLVIVLVVAMIAGLLAAIYPARRASRLNILDSLHYE